MIYQTIYGGRIVKQQGYYSYFKENQVAILVNLNPLKETISFPYLGRIVTHNNSDWVALYSNVWKSHRRWIMVAKVLGKTGVPIKA